jgi:hypothetical protein
MEVKQESQSGLILKKTKNTTLKLLISMEEAQVTFQWVLKLNRRPLMQIIQTMSRKFKDLALTLRM